MDDGASSEEQRTPTRSGCTFDVALLAARDDPEWRNVWTTFQRRLAVFFARKGFGDRSQDCVQETFLRAFRFFDGFRSATSQCTEGQLSGWLFKIATNVSKDEWHRENMSPGGGGDALDTRRARDAYAALERHLDVERALADLPTAQREAIELIYGGDLSFAEAAEATGKTEGTLKMRVQRAKVSLRRRLDDASDDADGNDFE